MTELHSSLSVLRSPGKEVAWQTNYAKTNGTIHTPEVVSLLFKPLVFLRKTSTRRNGGRSMKKYLFLVSVVVALCLGLIFSFGTAQAAQTPTVVASLAQEAGVTPTQPVSLTIPFLEDWMGSGHADVTALAFNDWNEDSPAEIPATCAKCHSTPGFEDFLGVDGSAPDVVDKPAAVGTTVECVACHNDAAIAKDSVTMPSGLVLAGLGAEARCMECHQGRESKVSVDKAIADSGATEPDAVGDKLGFKNIHYFAAAATKYGTLAKGGYEYDGNAYDGRFAHVQGYETCIDCHNQHTLKIKLDACKGCHENDELKIASVDDLKNIRMAGSQQDYNGNGDISEGIFYELEGLQGTLFTSIQTYATDVMTASIAYTSTTYPYFFMDTNGDGQADAEEAVRENRYPLWTPRLLKAAYNYQTSIKDPGSYAHGGKYIIQLLYDSIDDLNGALAEPVDMTAMNRIDAGHFAGSEMAFRDWDADGEVPATCARCHSASGLPQFLKEGTVVAQPISNGLECTTCHNDVKEFTIHEFKTVKFPSGATVDSGDMGTNLCMQCHQGRESSVSVDKLIGDTEADVQSDSLRFLNPHYFAAGATRYGGEAMGAYQYAGKEYLGYFEHDPEAANCADCHDIHTQEVKTDTCAECHEEVVEPEDIQNIRYTLVDYNGNGDDAEGVYFELQSMRDALYAVIQTYAADTVGKPILYVGDRYPYFFNDTNANGEADADEVNADNRFASWTPRLLRAAYNYQYSGKDPGAFAHNGQYVLQTVYDSIEDVGGDVAAMTRP